MRDNETTLLCRDGPFPVRLRLGRGARRRAPRERALGPHDARREGRPARADQRLGRPAARRAQGAPAPGPARLDAERDRACREPGDPAHRGRGEPARHPAADGPRRDPRLPHDLPDPARAGRGVEPAARDGLRRRRRRGGGRGRLPVDVRADDGHRARPALGPDRRGLRRGHAPCERPGRGDGPRLPGRRLRRAGPHRGLREALRGLRRGGGRPRLRHRVDPGGPAARRLPAALQGRGGRRRRDGDDLVQRDQRRSLLRQRVPAAPGAARRVGLQGLRRQRLELDVRDDQPRLREGPARRGA